MPLLPLRHRSNSTQFNSIAITTVTFQASPLIFGCGCSWFWPVGRLTPSHPSPQLKAMTVTNESRLASLYLSLSNWALADVSLHRKRPRCMNCHSVSLSSERVFDCANRPFHFSYSRNVRTLLPPPLWSFALSFSNVWNPARHETFWRNRSLIRRKGRLDGRQNEKFVVVVVFFSVID